MIKKLLLVAFAMLPLTVVAQSVKTLTPEEQLKEAQKQLEAAQKAVEQAKAAKAAAEAKAAKQAADAKAKEIAAKQAAIEEQIKKAKEEAARLNAEAEKIKQESAGQSQSTITYNNTDGWVAPAVPAMERRIASRKVEEADMTPYLAGAVPVVDEKVVFTLDVDVPGKDAANIYQTALNYLSELTVDEHQNEQATQKSAVALVNPNTHVIATRLNEWLVFKDNFISLDRTEFTYVLITTCTDGHLKMTMERMVYNYEPNRPTGFKLTAEKLITDEYSLNKKKTKLVKVYGKFRRETINRKNAVFEGMKAALRQ